MQSVKELIPKDKGDIQTALKLKGYTYEEVKPIIPDLLEWLQDLNWPVAGPVVDYLETIYREINADIIKVLRGNDSQWKYSCLLAFGKLEPVHPLFLHEIRVLVDRITDIEIDVGVLEEAQAILKQHEVE